ncbi:Betaine aldehyde dehydrogenase [Hyphodiscus hymeniophilus]|uniref:Betaine aldehyde dehydrogenase n=1 Tax=Hyphodiscus hymeniophilus TaxID=353542 RepID=A0A9P7AXW6_9HELO|nr:Betaine aldehyde dehydrogenase [Hyphodiscus hymeniophilus]
METTRFTHIVVGAGSAGCVVTAKIVENPNSHVLLIEAGPDSNPAGAEVPQGVRNARKVPMKGQSELFDPTIDWNVVVDIPGGQSMIVPQAKIMGGGSSINGGTALRNTAADCREWAGLGNDSWDFDTVSRIYQELEDDELRGTRGLHPIVRTLPDEAGRIQKAFAESALASGFQGVLDFNEPGAEGVGPSPVCRRGHQRVSASNTFIDPIRGRKNLTILTGTEVDMVEFSGKRATGVVLADGRKIAASEEVIISAGGIFSPAILQRSGLGSSSLLNSLGISTISDLPVGHNLSDHVCIPIVAKPRIGAYANDDYSLQMQARWSSSLLPGWTDLQMVCFSYLNAPVPSPGTQARSLSGSAVGHVAGIGCNLNKPTSMGSVMIKCTDAREAPKVAPNYLQTDQDRKAAREVVRKAFEVITSAPMQRVLTEPTGLDVSILESDESLDDWIQRQYSTTYHFSGTCRMADQDKGGVVDQSGRVYGVQGLRVCDASIIPTSPAANTMWTTMMFAQRIGKLVAASYTEEKYVTQDFDKRMVLGASRL